MHKNFKNVAIHLSCHEKARFISKITGLSLADVVEELVNEVFSIACTFEKANLEFESCVTDSTVMIAVRGRNRLVTGEFSFPTSKTDAQTDKEIRKRLKKP